ncbi:MAG: hypothetical protein V4736_04270 [Bdellovibrionota bacterium]
MEDSKKLLDSQNTLEHMAAIIQGAIDDMILPDHTAPLPGYQRLPEIRINTPREMFIEEPSKTPAGKILELRMGAITPQERRAYRKKK